MLSVDLLQRFANLLQEAIESDCIINNNLNELTKLVSSICQKQAALQVEVDVLIAHFSRENDVNEEKIMSLVG
ncbi:hypothetical protein HanXRQr2_Chr16g0766431 [Helianthus annuus]|uniref:Uncharacterized protein n=1 Tax=Helianthus annuus TaxID=4232 RepID=A0A251S1R4_HELAN|nr:hypothetical protein HanXRQr2_Chr16g0766431 [Helianthus annuus]